MSDAHLAVNGLSVRYGRTQAVDGVSIEVPRGALVTILGANGAGKSTLLNAVMGVLPSRGGIRFGGRPIDALALEARVALGLSLVPERRELFADLCVEDNLRLGAFRRRRDERDAALEDVYGQFPRLRERHRQLAGTLSGGERQMLAMGRALMSRPSLLMLDEPSLGLAPRIVAEVFERLVALREGGVSLLLVAFALFFERTLLGKALRACSSNRLGARLVGIPTATAGSVAFALAAGLGAISGVLAGPIVTIYYDSGFLIGLKAFVAAILGGLVSFPLTVLASVAVGIAEAFFSFWASNFKEVLVFTLILPVLMWRSLRSPAHAEDD